MRVDVSDGSKGEILAPSTWSPLCPGGLNRSTQHFILRGHKDSNDAVRVPALSGPHAARMVARNLPTSILSWPLSPDSDCADASTCEDAERVS
jgi:hypothetical protein